jgi:hypothetical protein
MAAWGLAATVGRLLFVVATRLAPLFPLPSLLAIESWALSKFSFSSVQMVWVRIYYLLLIVICVYLTYVLAMICWWN